MKGASIFCVMLSLCASQSVHANGLTKLVMKTIPTLTDYKPTLRGAMMKVEVGPGTYVDKSFDFFQILAKNSVELTEARVLLARAREVQRMSQNNRYYVLDPNIQSDISRVVSELETSLIKAKSASEASISLSKQARATLNPSRLNNIYYSQYLETGKIDPKILQGMGLASAAGLGALGTVGYINSLDEKNTATHRITSSTNPLGLTSKKLLNPTAAAQ